MVVRNDDKEGPIKERMKIYEEKFMSGHFEEATSAMKNAAVTKLRRQTPSFNVFQAQRRGINVRDVEKGPSYFYTNVKKDLPNKDMQESLNTV